MPRRIEPADLERFRAYGDREPCWGSLHIALDDENLNDECVQFCVEDARKSGDSEGLGLAEILLALRPIQRQRLYRILNR